MTNTQQEKITETLYFTVSTAGHVDHGKTSLLRVLTGIDPDRLKEEKQRQMTTDLGFAHLRLPAEGIKKETDVVISFIDVPGHGKFLKNMLAGVGGLDMALLVVAADEGPMPQTVQHAKILSLLGIKRVLLIITKTDMASPAQLETAVSDSRQLLDDVELELVDIAEVSNVFQKGFSELRAKLVKALVEGGERESARLDAPPFLPIDRVFTVQGYGVVVTGTLVKGSISIGDNLIVEPGNLKARVRGLETFNTSIPKATAGQRLAINLALKENKTLERGQVVVGEQCVATKTLIVTLSQPGLKLEDDFKKNVSSQPARIYHGTAECPGAVRWMEALPEDDQGRQSYIAQVALYEPLIAEPGDKFILRFGDDGLAGGTILVTTRPRWISRESLNRLAKHLALGEQKAALLEFLNANPQRLLKDSIFNCFLPPLVLPKVVAELVAENKLTHLADFAVTTETHKDLFEKLVSEVENSAKTQSASSASQEHRNDQEALRNRILPGLERAAFQALVKEGIEKQKIVRQAEKLLPAQSAKVETPAALSELCTKVMDVLTGNFCLEIDEITRQVSSDRRSVQSALQLLSKENLASIVAHDFASSSKSINLAHKQLERLFTEKKDIGPGDFKESIGVTRKYAMALLTYFDDKAITRRMTDRRVLLKYPTEETKE
ncbi:MAG: selenocysteine-specific translation elongation factor [Leptolyngbya sp.]|nr:selenocysteine-specific translation elongation factor [Candidatus Melainabacteria bacterium]